RHTELRTIEGTPPDLLNPPQGCPFMPRCLFARNICRTMPGLDPLPGVSAHHKACWIDVTDPNERANAERRRQARQKTQEELRRESFGERPPQGGPLHIKSAGM
ncbi:MAG TPA: oligopeptide/dipeptide ABC transporter ATP-binding protein, partial [Ktedonobacteraceae bacterium]